MLTLSNYSQINGTKVCSSSDSSSSSNWTSSSSYVMVCKS